ncbi:methanobactin export MATE transporter MbnM [Pseudobacteriovorax antillogorgiicola]|uniref:Cytochrome c peroxidase n=1 Tax=Pseudobacteriovorax antillogorgiicola TaxID=1513793 RepID=A0A1Y6BV40_9BACT|nr:methanobactin export MATE transporter MbnM [Pseudobacteriovorax antillogorgiicola]TCS53017.1 cytochrome c peroxidase [Pseudobacteriovorax antillogorgiicola]SMF26909.1 cytochrome c peroxidase [Pseudobacteriovorax antillogorgiicola]
MSILNLIAYTLLGVFIFSCLDRSETTTSGDIISDIDFTWNIPDNIPLPVIPENNSMTEAKFQLGRYLFYDERLSGNSSQSCSSCHQQDKAFSDGIDLAIGSTGEIHPRNSQSLVNVAYNPTITWANPSLRDLETQIMIPLFGENPIEQGITDESLPTVIQRLKEEAIYDELFVAAFPNDSEHYTTEQIVKAIACFVRALTSFNSPYDQFLAGDETAISASALRGRDLFFSESLECFHCHGGYNFTDSVMDRTMTFIERPFHNTGLFNIDGNGDYPDDNQGVFEITGDPDDRGKFRAVTLRNVAVSAPFMHDGSIATLDEVLDFYSDGGRNITSGPNQGDGRLNPLKDGFVTGFSLSEEERSDVVSFLESLTDSTFIENSRFQNPWNSN